MARKKKSDNQEEVEVLAEESHEWFRGSDDVRLGYVETNKFGRKQVEYSVIDGIAIFEGDIALGEVDAMESIRDDEFGNQSVSGEKAFGVGVTGEKFRWPGGIVSYEIDPALPRKERVTNAIAHWTRLGEALVEMFAHAYRTFSSFCYEMPYLERI